VLAPHLLNVRGPRTITVSFTNDDNDYQQEQAAAAEKAARRLGVEVKIIHANNDALAQSEQLLHYVQGAAVALPMQSCSNPRVARHFRRWRGLRRRRELGGSC
jgi:hypothetical protein